MRAAHVLCALVVAAALARAAPASARSSLAGAWGAGTGAFGGLVLLDRDGRHGLVAYRTPRCVAAPCPPVRVAGRWRARGGILHLVPRHQPPLALRYRVRLRARPLLRAARLPLTAGTRRITAAVAESCP